jgi:DNA-binding NarL/FixJ family response regulator
MLSPGDLHADHVEAIGLRRRCPLATLWEAMLAGRLVVRLVVKRCDGVFVVARRPVDGRPLRDMDAAIVTKLLCGSQQKEIGFDFGIAPSTVSVHCRRALRALGVVPQRVPTPMMLAAQSFAGLVSLPDAQKMAFEHHGSAWATVGVARPTMEPFWMLSPAEREVTRAFIEGETRGEIATRRATTIHTVGAQLRSIYGTLRASGRPSLIRVAAERGCFAPPADVSRAAGSILALGPATWE